MKPPLLILFYLLIVTAPLLLSSVFGGPPRSFRQELASGLGMLAFAMILVEFVLAGRFRSVSERVGMDVTMRVHQMMARVALAFALLHPLLYGGTLTGGPRPWDPTHQLTLTTNIADLSSGIMAYLLLPSLVLLAVGRTGLGYRYETWRLVHGVGALVIAALLLHHTVNAGRYGREPVLTWFWLVLTGVAAGSLLYVYVIVPLRERGERWRVQSLRRLSPRQWALTIAPVGHEGLSYKAGQFVWLNIGHSPFTLHENPFSISSAPASGPNISFLIKELGDFTGALDQIKPGTLAYLDGPYGTLTIDGRSEPGIVLIAGGVGVAPILGILQQMRLTNDTRPVKLIYGNRREAQIICREELADEDVTYVLAEPPPGWPGEIGVVDAALIDRVVSHDHIAQSLFVLCGPPGMMRVVENALIARGTPSSRILSESFSYD